MSDIDLIKKQVTGELDSFSFRLRYDRVWDEERLYELIAAMYRVAEEHASHQEVERELAYSYYFCADTFRTWINAGHFNKDYSQEYYEYVIEIFNYLNRFLLRDNDRFLVMCDGFSDLIERIKTYR